MTQDQRVTLELGGMVTEHGRVGRPIDADAVLKPDRARMRLDDQNAALLYDTRAPLLEDVHRPELLDAFVGLKDASPTQILEFARTYGTLAINSIREEGLYAEPLTLWHEYIGRASATLSIASRVHQKQNSEPKDWEHLRPWWWEGWDAIQKRKDPTARRRAVERLQLEDVMNRWLTIAEIRPVFSWRSGIGFTNLNGVDEGNVTMLGALALQLVLAVKRAKAILTCDGCGNTYTREGRQPAKGRRNYCKNCGIKAARRDAQARFRAARRSDKRGLRHGTTRKK
jgi:hypothetical protein